jgi:hypothetical protein
LQSALPRTITDSTPSTHCWASAYGLFSVPLALFKRGCPPRSTRRAVFPPGSSYFAAARIGCSETVFHPSAFGLGRLSAVPHLPARPNRSTYRFRGFGALPIPVPRIAARQYFLAIHVLHQDVTAVIADRMAGVALMIAHQCSSSVCCCYL